MVHRLHPDVDLRQHPHPLPRLPHRHPLQERPREVASEHEEKNLVRVFQFTLVKAQHNRKKHYLRLVDLQS